MRRPALEPGWLGRALILLTWGSVAIEFALVLGLVARRPVRPYLLAAGVLLHVSIGTLIGLGSFTLAMLGCLVMYLRPLDVPFALKLKESFAQVIPPYKALQKHQSP